MNSIPFLACLLVLANGANTRFKLQQKYAATSQNKELVGVCPVLCYCIGFICYCCNSGQVCCPDGVHCCAESHSYCCPNGPYCCPADREVCCIDTGLCCPTSASQCCPEACCSEDETCCGENCCSENEKCCEGDNGDKYCCGTGCCNNICCTEGKQCCSEYNAEDKEMEKVCEESPTKSISTPTEDIFRFSDKDVKSVDTADQLQMEALAVGQGDCTIIT